MAVTLEPKDPAACWRAGLALQWALRNPRTVEALDKVYTDRYGQSRTQLTARLLRDVPKDAPILEVGSAAGVQLSVLRGLGFTHLTGLDLEPAVMSLGSEKAVCGDAGALPFRDGAFGLVFTSGVLIHIPIEDLPRVYRELHRISSRWVAGFEPYCYQRKAYIWPGYITTVWLDWYAAYWRQSGLRMLSDEVLMSVGGEGALGVYLGEKA